jgi:predicted TIM-barrel fold metal-dependent hydrolase
MPRIESADRLSSVDELDTVVDADSHLTETAKDIAPFIDDRFSGIREIVEECDKPSEDIYSRAHVLPGHSHEYTSSLRPATTPRSKVEPAREFGIDYTIVDPGRNLHLNTVQNRRFGVALANAYNSFLEENFFGQEESLRYTIVAAPQVPEEAAREIERVGPEDDVTGVMVPSTGLIPPAGHPRYDPIYEAAEDLGLPVVFHGASGAMAHGFPTQHKWSQTFAEDHMIAHPFTQMWNLNTMVFQGSFERFPDLDVVFQESGVGWIPFMKWRMDDHYLDNPDQLANLSKLPSEYIGEQCYFTTQPVGHTTENPSQLAMAIEMTGPDSLMYSSDLPHGDWDPPEELFGRIHRHFDAETVERIMGGTAREVYTIDA